jgi:hypothetical protein
MEARRSRAARRRCKGGRRWRKGAGGARGGDVLRRVAEAAHPFAEQEKHAVVRRGAA